MVFVDSATYIDSDGNEHSDLDVDNPDEMERVKVVFDCPICEEENEIETKTPFPKDMTFTCPHCQENYYTYPMKAPKGQALHLMELSRRVELQLESVSKFDPIAKEHPRITIEMVGSLKVAGMSFVALAVGTIAILLMGNHAIEMNHNSSVIIGYLLMAIAIGVGSVASASGGMSDFIRGYRLYRSLDEVHHSFMEFLRHAGNYHHRDPY